MRMLKAPILRWTPAPSNVESDMVEVACPYCGRIHGHGVGEGPRSSECSGGGSYELGDEKFARQRRLHGDKSLAQNPFRSDREIALQIKRRPGWTKVPLRGLEEAIGDYIRNHHSRPDVMRTMTPDEFANWLKSDEFLMVAMLLSFTIYHIGIKEVLHNTVWNYERPRHPKLREATVSEFKRRTA
jgi:hypothetical protein